MAIFVEKCNFNCSQTKGGAFIRRVRSLCRIDDNRRQSYSQSHIPKEGFAGLIYANPSFGRSMTKIVRPVSAWHGSRVANSTPAVNSLPLHLCKVFF